MKLNYTIDKIDSTIKRASKISFEKNSYMKKRFRVLKDLRSKMNNPNRPLTESQVNYLNKLMESFSDCVLEREENWENEWKTNAITRERADVVSKYYIAQKGWFMEVARDIQSILQNPESNPSPPDWAMTERMMYNDYADKVWKSHNAPHRWEAGELVCCRANARTDGWHYYNRVEGINVHKDPCMVIKSGSKPISNASKYDEKRGGCRWVAINPIGSDRIFHVMEKDLKVFRQPKKKGKKK